MRSPTSQTRRRLAASRLALSALAVLACGAIAAPAHAAAQPSAHAAKRTAGHGAASARRRSASLYPSGVSRPRDRGGSARRAHSAAAKKPAKKPSKPKLTGNPARALLAFEAMQRYYYVRGSGLYAGEPFSYLWPFSQALAATVSMANVPGLPVSLSGELHARLIGLRTYLDQDNSGRARRHLYEHAGSLRRHRRAASRTRRRQVLRRQRLDRHRAGAPLQKNPQRRRPRLRRGDHGLRDGRLLDRRRRSPAPAGFPSPTASKTPTATRSRPLPPPSSACSCTRSPATSGYLQFAETAYNWVRTCLLQPNNLYADHIRPHGVVDSTFWSYNQGVMIGAGTLLYQATGNSGYLYQARQTAQAARAYFTPQRLGEENPFFPSVYFRNLLYLDSVTHDPPGPKIAQAYVDYAWQHLRLSNNLFVAGSPASAQLLYQAAIVQIYALLSSSPSTYF